MSLLLTYLSRKALIAENLQSMGVNSANSNNGLTTLAGKILNIEPSVSGLNIETSINLRSSTNTSFVGQSITFEAEVIVTYDDETATNVDLSGVLTGATIIFKNGDNVLGTSITDTNGIATYTCAFNTMGNRFITATFEGTDNFVGCTSSSINVSTNYDITISCNKSILSYAHNDTATINCLLSDGLGGKSGETLSYEILNTDDKLIDSGSGITNSSGEVNFTYNSCGIGDITIIVYYSNLFQKTFIIEDCYYFNDGSNVGSLEISSGVSCTSNGSYITITTDTSGEKYVWIPVTLANSDNWIFEGEIADTGTSQPIAISYDNSNKWAGHSSSVNQWFANSGTNDTYTQAYQVGDVLRITRENGYDKAQVNDHQYSNIQATHNSTFKVGFYTNNGRTQKVKNIKLKALSTYDLSVSASDDIVSSGDTTTLTATLTDNSVPLTGETLSYQIKHGSTTIDTGTDTTDNNGQVEISYTGTGIGDVDVIVSYGSLLQETYEVIDADIYLPLTSDISSYMQSKPSAFSVSYSSDGMYISSSSYATWYMNSQYTIPKSVEFELKAHTSSAPLIQFASNPLVYVEFKSNKTSIDLNGTTVNVASTIGKWRFEVYSNEIKAYKDNTLVGTKTINMNTLELAIAVSGSRNCTLKDLIIKAL